MMELISRSEALRMVCYGCMCNNGENYNYPCAVKCAEYIDIENIPAVSDEEFEAEAKRRGYKLTKDEET